VYPISIVRGYRFRLNPVACREAELLGIPDTRPGPSVASGRRRLAVAQRHLERRCGEDTNSLTDRIGQYRMVPTGGSLAAMTRARRVVLLSSTPTP
jgi:hypothetical protein